VQAVYRTRGATSLPERASNIVRLQGAEQEAVVAERAQGPQPMRDLGVCARAQVWLVEDGKVTEYPGYFEDYKNELVKEIAAEMEDDEPAGPTKP